MVASSKQFTKVGCTILSCCDREVLHVLQSLRTRESRKAPISGITHCPIPTSYGVTEYYVNQHSIKLACFALEQVWGQVYDGSVAQVAGEKDRWPVSSSKSSSLRPYSNSITTSVRLFIINLYPFHHNVLTHALASILIMATAAMTNMINGAQGVINYNFNDPLILWEALQAAGSPVHAINGRRLLDGNKRLAIVGDRVLELALAEGWYEGTEARGTQNSAQSYC